MDDLTVPKRRRGIYLLPNLFTTGTLFGGFYAIVAAIKGEFAPAAIAIFVAMVCDPLDGVIARKTNTASEFGKEYDSLCDMVAFGVGTSVVMYMFSLHFLSEYPWLGGKLGWVAAFAYTACAALRLARFNVLSSRGEAKGAFFGLPSPAAAAVMVGFVWMADEFGFDGEVLVIPAVIITLGTAVSDGQQLALFQPEDREAHRARSVSLHRLRRRGADAVRVETVADFLLAVFCLCLDRPDWRAGAADAPSAGCGASVTDL